MFDISKKYLEPINHSRSWDRQKPWAFSGSFIPDPDNFGRQIWQMITEECHAYVHVFVGKGRKAGIRSCVFD
jgi:hypothetical protein